MIKKKTLTLGLRALKPAGKVDGDCEMEEDALLPHAGNDDGGSVMEKDLSLFGCLQAMCLRGLGASLSLWKLCHADG